MSESGNGEGRTGRPAWPHASPLIHGDDDPLLPHLAACFPKARLVCIAVAFVLDQGVDLIRPFLVDLLANGGGSALGNGVEWNYRIVASSDAIGFAAVTRGFDELFAHERTVPLTAEWIAAYRVRRVVAARGNDVEVASEEVAPAVAHAVQREALAALRRARELGHRAGLVVLATGLGKTWLSAFDSVAFASERGDCATSGAGGNGA